MDAQTPRLFSPLGVEHNSDMFTFPSVDSPAGVGSGMYNFLTRPSPVAGSTPSVSGGALDYAAQMAAASVGAARVKQEELDTYHPPHAHDHDERGSGYHSGHSVEQDQPLSDSDHSHAAATAGRAAATLHHHAPHHGPGPHHHHPHHHHHHRHHAHHPYADAGSASPTTPKTTRSSRGRVYKRKVVVDQDEEYEEYPAKHPRTRREKHIQIERKRREIIAQELNHLRDIIPACRAKDSKATVLTKTVEYVNMLHAHLGGPLPEQRKQGM